MPLHQSNSYVIPVKSSCNQLCNDIWWKETTKYFYRLKYNFLIVAVYDILSLLLRATTCHEHEQCKAAIKFVLEAAY